MIETEKYFFRDLYYDLINSYNIKVYEEYRFIHEFFLEHLISDTKKSSNKNPNKNDNVFYNTVVFKICLYRHLSNGKWNEKLVNPNKFPELIKMIRKEKIKKIKYGML